MTIFNQRFARLGFLFMLNCLMVLTPAYGKVGQAAGTNTACDRRCQEEDDQANLQTLYTFPDNDHPRGLIQATDGNFYGSTLGVEGNSERLFRFTPEGKFTTLHSFVSATDGAGLVPELWQSQQADTSLVLYGTTMWGGANGQGTLFVYQPDGVPSFKPAFSFQGPGSVRSGVVETSTGMFVGTMEIGGEFGAGSLYGYIPDKLFGKTIYSFSGPYGSLPKGGLISDREFVYGFTTVGGANNCGTIFKFNSSDKTLETLYSFKGGSDGAFPQEILLDKDDNLYGISVALPEGDGIFFKLNLTNNTLTPLVSFGKTSNGLATPFSIIQGSDRNFYGLTLHGGKNDQGSIFRATPTGKLTTLYSWDREVIAVTPSALIQGRDGNLYGVASSVGAGDAGMIFKLSLGK